MHLEVTVSLLCNRLTHRSLHTITLITSYLYVFPRAAAARAEHSASWRHRCERWHLGHQGCVLTSGRRPQIATFLTLPLHVLAYPCPSRALPLWLWGCAGGAGSRDEAERPHGEPVPGRAVSGPSRRPRGAATLWAGEREEVPLHDRGKADQS